MTFNAGQAAMTDVLSLVAVELDLARNACARLDGALGRLLHAASPETRSEVMRELHVIDLLNQQIAAVAGFVERLSDGLGPATTIEVGEALRSITLGEVAHRISVGLGHAAPAAAAHEDIDFF